MKDNIDSGVLFQKPMTRAKAKAKGQRHSQQDSDLTQSQLSGDVCKKLGLGPIHEVVNIAQSCLKPEHCYVCADLAIVDQEISSTHQRLSDLIQKRGQIIKKPHQTTFIQDIPVETLSSIFIFVKESYNDGSGKPLFSQPDRSPPLLLGAVCKGWRDVALRTPQMWTDIIVDLGKSPGTQLSLIKEWARRSGALPLRVVVFLDRDFAKYKSKGKGDGIPVTRRCLIKALRSHAARWDALALRTPWTVHRALLDGLAKTPPITSLHSHVADAEWSPPHTRGPIKLQQQQHPLRPKYLYCQQQFAPTKNIPLQWGRLVHLEVREIGSEDLLDIIRHAQNLRHCDTPQGFRPEGQRSPLAQGIVTHRSLVYLRSNHDILGHLTLPSLKHLEYTVSNKYIGHRGPEGIESLEEFLHRSSPPLDTFILRVNIVFDQEDEVSASLVNIPGVTHLYIDFVDDMDSDNGEWLDAFLLNLTAPSPKLLLLRQLEEITLDATFIPRETWSLLCEILKAIHTYESTEEGSTTTCVVRPKFKLSKVRIYVEVNINNEVSVTKDDFLDLLAMKKSGFDLAVQLRCGEDWFSELAKVFYVTL